MRSNKAVGGLLALALLATGCEGFLTSFAAGSTIRVFSRAAPALQAFADPDLAEAALPSSMATLEGLMVIVPDSEALHLNLTRAYSSYGFGFMEDHMEQSLAEDNEAAAEHYRARASAAFMRARAIGFEQMNMWEPDDGGVEGHLRRGLPAWRQYIGGFERHQVPQLFWTTYAWARYVGNNRDDVNAIADLPFITALAERIQALDPSYQEQAPRSLVAGLMGSTPAGLGGRPAEARVIFDQVIAASGRRNLMYLVLEARIIAVALQDRRMYRANLEEVINAGDVDPGNRLSNQLAKRRAQRYLAQIEDLFLPEEPGGGNGANDSAPAPQAQEGTQTPTAPVATP